MEQYRLVVDAITGNSEMVPLTKAELDRAKKENALFAVRVAELEAKAAAKQAVLDKLGLTAEEVAALLG
jgi:hypothetical protein